MITPMPLRIDFWPTAITICVIRGESLCVMKLPGKTNYFSITSSHLSVEDRSRRSYPSRNTQSYSRLTGSDSPPVLIITQLANCTKWAPSTRSEEHTSELQSQFH